MAIGESERLSCIEGARSAFERTATGFGCGPFMCRRRAAQKHTECAVPAGTPPQGGKKGFNWIVRIFGFVR